MRQNDTKRANPTNGRLSGLWVLNTRRLISFYDCWDERYSNLRDLLVSLMRVQLDHGSKQIKTRPRSFRYRQTSETSINSAYSRARRTALSAALGRFSLLRIVPSHCTVPRGKDPPSPACNVRRQLFMPSLLFIPLVCFCYGGCSLETPLNSCPYFSTTHWELLSPPWPILCATENTRKPHHFTINWSTTKRNAEKRGQNLWLTPTSNNVLQRLSVAVRWHPLIWKNDRRCWYICFNKIEWYSRPGKEDTSTTLQL